MKRYRFQALVTLGDSPDPREYFDIGDSFAFWFGSDRARGVVTRRLLV